MTWGFRNWDIPRLLWFMFMAGALLAGGWAIFGSCGCSALERLDLVRVASEAAADRALLKGKDALVDAAGETVDHAARAVVSEIENVAVKWGIGGTGGAALLGGGGLAWRRKRNGHNGK